MDDEVFARAFGDAPVGSESELDALAREVREQASESARGAVSLWRGFVPPVPARAGGLLERLGAPGLAALLESRERAHELQEVWRVRVLARAELALRTRVIERLRAALADRHASPTDDNPQMDEPEIPRRVCDDAYTLLRRLTHLGEPIERYYLNERAFLLRESPEKDAAITAAQGGQWTDFTGSEGG